MNRSSSIAMTHQPLPTYMAVGHDLPPDYAHTWREDALGVPVAAHLPAAHDGFEAGPALESGVAPLGAAYVAPGAMPRGAVAVGQSLTTVGDRAAEVGRRGCDFGAQLLCLAIPMTPGIIAVAVGATLNQPFAQWAGIAYLGVIAAVYSKWLCCSG